MLNLDSLIIEFDKGLRTLFAKAPTARPYPDAEHRRLGDERGGKETCRRADAHQSHRRDLRTGFVSGAGAHRARPAGAGEVKACRVGRDRASGVDLASRV